MTTLFENYQQLTGTVPEQTWTWTASEINAEKEAIMKKASTEIGEQITICRVLCARLALSLYV